MKYFITKELACPCCGASGVTEELKIFLDQLREDYGKPIVIKSAYRCKKHNDEVGGVPESAHTTGEAVDVGCSFAVDRMKLLKLLCGEGILRIGVAKTFIHFDINKSLPQDVFWLY